MRSARRARTEQWQATLAVADFPLAMATNASVGPFNIRPQTARQALSAAIQRGCGPELGFPTLPADVEIIASILDPQRAVVVVQAILVELRAAHPLLRDLSWQQIEASDELIAKLYSGYLGAGGQWDAWRADAQPGPEALRRLEFQHGRSRTIARHRPPGPSAPRSARPLSRVRAPRRRPLTISVLAVLTLLGGLPALLFGLLVLSLGGVVASGWLGDAYPPAQGFMALVVAIPLLLSASLALATSVGLWRMRRWAWPLGLVTQSLALLGSVGALATNGWRAVPEGALALGLLVYLLQPAVRRAFGR